ncbi:MAG: class I SAM-dependent methyltransferase [Rickettsiales bacterium]|nr:class I SAM-dependent methyltransferase [Rickettsiales bacterium]
MLQLQIVKKFLDIFRNIECGCIQIIMPNGKSLDFSGKAAGPQADLIIHDNRAISQFIKKGDIGFAESYRDGLWDSTDLSSLFLFGLKNEEALDRYIYGNFLTQIISRFAYLLNLNTLKGSKKNIYAHYDLGNDFYELWLDPSMTYSSAIFSSESEDLITAQYRKYDRILERLNDSGRLLEIGCGWGGFAERAINKGNYEIKGITISEKQHEYATKRLNGTAVISIEDYRFQQGKYDQIVSIEMFEAVGEKFWPTYFSQIKSLLSTKGKAIIQTITIKDQYFERYRKSGDPIRTFIFPGGMLPSPERFINSSNKLGLCVTDQFAFGKDYALTLTYWLHSFEQKLQQVKALGFDDKFIRMWRFYLTYCIASFKSGRIDVMQMELQHAAF